MIKKILLSLWLSIVSFLGFSSAWYIWTVWVNSSSPYNTQYSNTVSKNWNLLTRYAFLWKRLLQVQDWVYFFWSYDWQPYIYVTSNPSNFDHAVQWYVQKYALCNYVWLDTWSWVPEICNYYDFSTLSWSLSRYLSQWMSDYYYFDYYWQDVPNRDAYCASFTVCFSNSELNSSLCFYWTNWDNKFPCSYSSIISRSPWWTNLSNSLNLSPYFDWINASILWNSPWQDWWNIEWWSSVSENVSLSWNVMYNSCTNWYVISKLERYFKRSDCYAWVVPSLSSWSIVTSDMNFDVLWYMPWTWKTIIDVFNDTRWWNWTQYWDWINVWWNLIWKYKTRDMENPFIGAPVELNTLFNNLYNRWFVTAEWVLDPYHLLNYCKLKLNSSESNVNDPYNWTFFRNYCDNFNSDKPVSSVTTWEVWDVSWGDEVLPPWTDIWWWDWSITSSWNVISVNWSWSLSWDTNKNFEWKTFINDFYQKLQSKFSKPINNVVWIVPSYILVFMFALILFRFLSH